MKIFAAIFEGLYLAVISPIAVVAVAFALLGGAGYALNFDIFSGLLLLGAGSLFLYAPHSMTLLFLVLTCFAVIFG